MHSNFVQSCNQCDFLTKTKEKLTKHKKSGCYKFQCKICYFKTSQYVKHRKHNQEFHRAEDKKFICYSCDYKAVQKKDLESHLLNNSCYKYNCKSCEFKTSILKILQEHSNQYHPLKKERTSNEQKEIIKEIKIKKEIQNDPLFGPITSHRFACENCDYKSDKKKIYRLVNNNNVNCTSILVYTRSSMIN